MVEGVEAMQGSANVRILFDCCVRLGVMDIKELLAVMIVATASWLIGMFSLFEWAIEL
jgi:hypothetical protein